MPVAEIGDPRLQALFGADDPRDAGVRPTVRLPRKGVSTSLLIAGALVFASLLFFILDGRRTAREPSGEASGAAPAVVQFEAPPPLYIPPASAPVVVSPAIGPQRPLPLLAPPVAVPVQSPQRQVITYVPPAAPQAIPVPPLAVPTRTSAGAPLVIDTSSGQSAATTAPAAAPSPFGSPSQAVSRQRASALSNPSMTVPQGVLIPAVLETAFDSTKPGFARALVSRNVRSFDSRNVLIPRGSRLIGEYRSDTTQGQKRAAIVWTRLIRPDGMTIAMDAPAVDTLGRGGVRASVNSHFFGRLGEALLQSTFEIGRTIAGRAINNPVVVLPSGNTSMPSGQIMPSSNYVPTLSVPAGKSISVFVAQDLDFSAAGAGR